MANGLYLEAGDRTTEHSGYRTAVSTSFCLYNVLMCTTLFTCNLFNLFHILCISFSSSFHFLLSFILRLTILKWFLLWLWIHLNAQFPFVPHTNLQALPLSGLVCEEREVQRKYWVICSRCSLTAIQPQSESSQVPCRSSRLLQPWADNVNGGVVPVMAGVWSRSNTEQPPCRHP